MRLLAEIVMSGMPFGAKAAPELEWLIATAQPDRFV
jgi:hypothetical protein